MIPDGTTGYEVSLNPHMQGGGQRVLLRHTRATWTDDHWIVVRADVAYLCDPDDWGEMLLAIHREFAVVAEIVERGYPDGYPEGTYISEDLDAVFDPTIHRVRGCFFPEPDGVLEGPLYLVGEPPTWDATGQRMIEALDARLVKAGQPPVDCAQS